MRALRNCDFCDAESVGAFEVVPPELEPTEAEQRRVVLCRDCKNRLETLLEPLLARAGADVDAGTGAELDTDRGVDDGTEPETESGTVVAAADESTATRPRTGNPNATVSETEAASRSAADADAEPDSSSDSIFAESAATDSAPSQSSTDAGEGITFTGEREGRTTDDEAAPSRTDADTGDDDAADSDATDDANGSETNGDAAADQPPQGYAKVIRLLRNRAFPMDRRAVEELAAGAYDLESDEVDAILEHAIEDGEFVEQNGALHRP